MIDYSINIEIDLHYGVVSIKKTYFKVLQFNLLEPEFYI